MRLHDAFEKWPNGNPLLQLRQDCRQEYRVILYAKGDLHGATALADELQVEDMLAVEHNRVANQNW